MTRENIIAATKEHSGDWGYQHTQRLFKLIDMIHEGREYQQDVLWYAVYMHDWGGYAPYKQEGVNHALRSKQVAEEILPNTDIAPELIPLTLETIEYHDYRDERKAQSLEAILLRDADFLDFLGAIGIARAFAAGPKDIKKGVDILLKRKACVEQKFTLPKAKELAKVRLGYIDDFLNRLQTES